MVSVADRPLNRGLPSQTPIAKKSEQADAPERSRGVFDMVSRLFASGDHVVNTETARAQRVDRVALFIFAVARRRVSLVAGCLPVA